MMRPILKRLLLAASASALATSAVSTAALAQNSITLEGDVLTTLKADFYGV